MTRSAKGTILIVDDSDLQRELLRQAIEGHGYRVMTAGSGLEGIVGVFKDLPDLVVSDVVMPEVTGYHVCRFIKNDRLTRSIPIILLTSAALQKQDRFWGLQSGADAYLPKSDDPTALLVAIDGLLREPGRSRPAFATGQHRFVAGIKPQQIKSYLNFLFDKLLFESTLCNQVRKLGEQIHDREALLSAFAGVVDSLAEYAALAIAVVDARRAHLRVFLSQPAGPAEIKALKRAIAREIGAATGVAAERLEPEISPLALFDEWCNTTGDLGQCVTYTLQLGKETLGAVALLLAKGVDVDQGMDGTLTLATQELAPAIRTMLYHEETIRLSTSDGLTGAFNHRYFMQQLETEVQRFLRYGVPFSLVLIDLDDFKQINDVHGHLTGDAVLEGVARQLHEQLRSVDMVGRYGGDEFVAMLPATRVDRAVIVAEWLRHQVSKQAFGGPVQPCSATVSIGVASMSDSMRNGKDLIGAADAALYRAKEAGRNCVRVFRGLESAEELATAADTAESEGEPHDAQQPR